MTIVNKKEDNPMVTFGELKGGDIFYYKDAEAHYIKLTTNNLIPNAFNIETDMLTRFYDIDTLVTKVNAEIILKD